MILQATFSLSPKKDSNADASVSTVLNNVTLKHTGPQEG